MQNTTRRVVLEILLATFLLSAGGLGCSAGDDEDKNSNIVVPSGCTRMITGDHYIGSLLPISGAWPVGEGFERAIYMALTEINSSGGLGEGKKVGFLSCNDDGDRQSGTDLMSALGQTSNLGAVIGPGRSVVAIGSGASDVDKAACAETIKWKKVMVSPSATSPLIGNLQDDGYIFRTTVSDGVQGFILAKLSAREGFKKVFVAQPAGDAYCTGIREIFVKSFEEIAGKDAMYVEFTTDSQNFAQEVIDQAVQYGPDAIFIDAFVANGAALIKEVNTRTWPNGRPRFLLADAMKDPKLTDQVGNNAILEGVLGTSPAAPTGPDYTIFRTAHLASYGSEEGVFGANSYDAAYILSAAMALAVDPASGEELKKTIWKTQPGAGVRQFHPGQWAEMLAELKSAGQIDYEGASGDINFDEHGEVRSSIAEWTIKSGELVDGDNNCWTPLGTQCAK